MVGGACLWPFAHSRGGDARPQGQRLVDSQQQRSRAREGDGNTAADSRRSSGEPGRGVVEEGRAKDVRGRGEGKVDGVEEEECFGEDLGIFVAGSGTLLE